jgi:hypothetical protein
MLGHREYVRTSKLWQKSKENKRIFFLKFSLLCECSSEKKIYILFSVSNLVNSEGVHAKFANYVQTILIWIQTEQILLGSLKNCFFNITFLADVTVY